jgi:hypothetical protein
MFYSLFLSPQTNLEKTFNLLQFDPTQPNLIYIQVHKNPHYPEHILVLSRDASTNKKVVKQAIKDQLAVIGYYDSFDLFIPYKDVYKLGRISNM